ncbi:hypothetical protein KJZ61_02130 [Candidatus Dependentiae bacterium]|nr:hypothetical protein [Candidatus Dependentiae bacterium]
MHGALQHQVRIFWQLVKKELWLIRKGFLDKFADGIIIVAIQVLVFSHLLPLIGMPKTLIAPTFIGSIIQLFFSMGYGLSLRVVFDLQFARFIDYYLTLPLGKTWIFAVYIAQFVAEVAITTIPLVSFGIIAMGENFIMIAPSIPLFIIAYLLSLILIATLFLSFSFMYSFRWFFDNLWPRRLSPLFLCSSALFPWKKVYALSHTLGVLFLCNPLTYVAEALRGTLIGGPDFLSPLITIPAILCFCVIMLLICNKGITRRLDPV